MNKPRRSSPRKRPAREIDAKRNRAQRLQQRELLERYARRGNLPEPEEGKYKP